MANIISPSEVQQRFTGFAEANSTCIDLAYADDDLMIARCTLNMPFEIQPGDVQNGGVAVRATLSEVEVRPYLFRKVCTNGAIMMRSTSGSCIETVTCTPEWLETAFAAASSREALAACVKEVRTLAGSSLDRAFMFATFLERSRGIDNGIIREMIRRTIHDGYTGYSLMNAMTSVARDTPDPESRWRLEAAGGSLPALLLNGPTSRVGSDSVDPRSLVLNLGYELQPA